MSYVHRGVEYHLKKVVSKKKQMKKGHRLIIPKASVSVRCKNYDAGRTMAKELIDEWIKTRPTKELIDLVIEDLE